MFARLTNRRPAALDPLPPSPAAIPEPGVEQPADVAQDAETVAEPEAPQFVPAPLSDGVQRFRDDVRYRVQGWVSERTPELIDCIDKAHASLRISGDIAEIGVHHGLFLLLLAAVRRDGELIRAYDIFERQDLNVDHSGEGSIEAVQNAIRIFYPSMVDAFDLRALDSMSVRSSNVNGYFPNLVRLLSIDGGHTQLHVINDLNIAQEVLVGGGVAILDDFLGPHWPSVTEGFFRFMATANQRLAPFLYFENKLYLTTFSEHALLSAAVKEHLDARFGPEMVSGGWKYVELAGHRVISRS